MPRPDSPQLDSRFEALRLGGAVRGGIITYGVALSSFLMAQAGDARAAPGRGSGGGLLPMVLLAVVLQGVVLVLRWASRRYERAHDLEGQVTPLAMLLFELLVDGVTVALFAIGTFRGITRIADGI